MEHAAYRRPWVCNQAAEFANPAGATYAEHDREDDRGETGGLEILCANATFLDSPDQSQGCHAPKCGFLWTHR